MLITNIYILITTGSPWAVKLWGIICDAHWEGKYSGGIIWRGEMLGRIVW